MPHCTEKQETRSREGQAAIQKVEMKIVQVEMNGAWLYATLVVAIMPLL